MPFCSTYQIQIMKPTSKKQEPKKKTEKIGSPEKGTNIEVRDTSDKPKSRKQRIAEAYGD